MKNIGKRLRMTALVLACGCASQAGFALNILLTNDDGCRAPGIQTLYRALVAAGHHVTLAAPERDNSGMGHAGTVMPGARLKLTELAANQYCIGAPDDFRGDPAKNIATGTPVDAVTVGLDVLTADRRPDLVVSGINFGQNVGQDLPQSGTVNAAVKALNSGVPAIAVSAAIDIDLVLKSPQASYQKTLAALDDTARFVVRVIAITTAAAEKTRKACGADKSSPACTTTLLGLPPGEGLNINFPATGGAAPAVVVAPIGPWREIQFKATRSGANEITVNLAKSRAPLPDEQREDGYLLKAGNIVISPLAPNYGSGAQTLATVRQLFAGIAAPGR
jgi:5'-nucleotidase